jgi:hypothetical protein
MGGRHTYDRVLDGAPRGLFAILLSPPQCKQLLTRCLIYWLFWTKALFTVQGHYPPCDEDASDWILERQPRSKLLAFQLLVCVAGTARVNTVYTYTQKVRSGSTK